MIDSNIFSRRHFVGMLFQLGARQPGPLNEEIGLLRFVAPHRASEIPRVSHKRVRSQDYSLFLLESCIPCRIETVKQAAYSVYIAAHPSFTTRPPAIIYFAEGENAPIECRASGAPRPTVNWTRSVSPLPQGRSQQKGGRLNITDMQTQDSGNYTCEASNQRGLITTTAEFIVRPSGE